MTARFLHLQAGYSLHKSSPAAQNEYISVEYGDIPTPTCHKLFSWKSYIRSEKKTVKKHVFHWRLRLFIEAQRRTLSRQETGTVSSKRCILNETFMDFKHVLWVRAIIFKTWLLLTYSPWTKFADFNTSPVIYQTFKHIDCQQFLFVYINLGSNLKEP